MYISRLLFIFHPKQSNKQPLYLHHALNPLLLTIKMQLLILPNQQTPYFVYLILINYSYLYIS